MASAGTRQWTAGLHSTAAATAATAVAAAHTAAGEPSTQTSPATASDGQMSGTISQTRSSAVSLQHFQTHAGRALQRGPESIRDTEDASRALRLWHAALRLSHVANRLIPLGLVVTAIPGNYSRRERRKPLRVTDRYELLRPPHGVTGSGRSQAVTAPRGVGSASRRAHVTPVRDRAAAPSGQSVTS